MLSLTKRLYMVAYSVDDAKRMVNEINRAIKVAESIEGPVRIEVKTNDDGDSICTNVSYDNEA